MSKLYGGLVGLVSAATAITSQSDYDSALEVVPERKFAQDSAPNFSPIQTSTTTGAVHGGDTATPDFGLLDFVEVDNLRAQMESDDERFWAFKMADGTIYATQVPVNPFVNEQPQFNAENGLSVARLTFVRHHTTAVFKRI